MRATKKTCSHAEIAGANLRTPDESGPEWFLIVRNAFQRFQNNERTRRSGMPGRARHGSEVFSRIETCARPERAPLEK